MKHFISILSISLFTTLVANAQFAPNLRNNSPQNAQGQPQATPTPIPQVSISSFNGKIFNFFDLSVFGFKPKDEHIQCTLDVVDHYPDDLMAEDVTRLRAAIGTGKARCAKPFITVEEKLNSENTIERIEHKYTPREIQLIRENNLSEIPKNRAACLMTEKKELERIFSLPEYTELLKNNFKINQIRIDFVDNSDGLVPDKLLKQEPSLTNGTFNIPVIIDSLNGCNGFFSAAIMNFINLEVAKIKMNNNLNDVVRGVSSTNNKLNNQSVIDDHSLKIIKPQTLDQSVKQNKETAQQIK